MIAVPLLRGQSPKPNMFGNAEAYEQFMGRWSRLVAPLLVDFTPLPDTGRVLDVGSGTGSLAFSIAERKPRCEVLGLDPSKEYVAHANSKSPFPGRVRFETGDARELRFPDAAFQASLSLLVFNFIPDPAKALRELRRVTTPGGMISAAVWDYRAGMQMLRVFWDAAVSIDAKAESLDEKHMPLCRGGELSTAWKQAGLQNVHEQTLDITTPFATFTDYWDAFLVGQGPAGAYVQSLDDNQRNTLRAEVRRRLSLSSDGAPFTLPARVWSVRGAVPSRP